MPDLTNPANIFTLLFEILIKGLFAFSIIKMLEHVSIINQKIKPLLVWLLVIPGFNLFWNFFVAIKISDSLKNELNSRNFEVNGKPTLIMGIIYSTLSASALFIPIPQKLTVNMSLLYGIFGLAAFVVFVQYWVKINWYKQVLMRDTESNDFDKSL